MLNFRRRTKERNYLSAGEQRRLLVLVITLGLVVVVASEARKAKHYAWMWGSEPILNDGTPAQEIAEAAPPGSLASSDLESIRDGAPFRSAEHDAWFGLFEILQGSSAAALAEASVGQMSYVQLFQQSEAFRGKLVTISGTLGQAHRLRAPENEIGISDYYQTWVTPSDSPGNVVTVYCLGLPEGFPTGMKVAEEVQIDGFYFKRRAYEAQGRVHLAPVLLARSVRWAADAEAAEPRQENPLSLLAVVVAAGFFALVASAFVFYQGRRGRKSTSERRARLDLGPELRIVTEGGESLEHFPNEEEASGR